MKKPVKSVVSESKANAQYAHRGGATMKPPAYDVGLVDARAGMIVPRMVGRNGASSATLAEYRSNYSQQIMQLMKPQAWIENRSASQQLVRAELSTSFRMPGVANQMIRPEEEAEPQSVPVLTKNTTNETGMPDQLKAGIEALSGVSMDDVRVHYNSQNPAALRAYAYAQGTEIHIGPGQERRLPHEAWHVVQQKAGRVRTTGSIEGTPFNVDSQLEREATLMGDKAKRGAVGCEMASLTRMANPEPKKTGRIMQFDLDHRELLRIARLWIMLHGDKPHHWEAALNLLLSIKSDQQDQLAGWVKKYVEGRNRISIVDQPGDTPEFGEKYLDKIVAQGARNWANAQEAKSQEIWWEPLGSTGPKKVTAVGKEALKEPAGQNKLGAGVTEHASSITEAYLYASMALSRRTGKEELTRGEIMAIVMNSSDLYFDMNSRMKKALAREIGSKELGQLTPAESAVKSKIGKLKFDDDEEMEATLNFESNLNRAVKKLRSGRRGQYYRMTKTKFWGEVNVGDEVFANEGAPMSTSESLEGAILGGEGSEYLIIVTDSEGMGAPISDLSYAGESEQEVLFGSRQLVKVKNIAEAHASEISGWSVKMAWYMIRQKNLKGIKRVIEVETVGGTS